jgi:hypothetical protein
MGHRSEAAERGQQDLQRHLERRPLAAIYVTHHHSQVL